MTPSPTARRVPPALRALTHRNYRLLFIGQLISVCGVWMQATAQGWLVLRLSDSTFWLGMIAAAQSLPVLLLTLGAGTVADRVPKRELLLLTQVTAMASALVLALLTATGAVQVWQVLILALLSGTASAFEQPARQAFTIELVGREDLLGAIALDSMMFNGARIVGPAIAGVVAAAIGEAPTFLFNGLSFLATIGSLLAMRLVPRAAAPPRQAGQFREGMAYVWQTPEVRLLLGQLAIFSVFCMAYIPLLPSFARDVLQGDARVFGLLASVNAAGALVAATMISVWADRMPRRTVRTIALVSYSLLLAGFALMREVLPAAILLAAVGWAGVTTLTLTNTLLQMVVPDALRGRVMSVFVMLVMGVSQLSGLAVGAIAEAFDDVAHTVVIWTMIGWVLQVVLAWLEWRGDRLPRKYCVGRDV